MHCVLDGVEEEEDCDFWSASVVEAKPKNDETEGEIPRESKVLRGSCFRQTPAFTSCCLRIVRLLRSHDT